MVVHVLRQLRVWNDRDRDLKGMLKCSSRL
jgi:hypothetical protein